MHRSNKYMKKLFFFSFILFCVIFPETTKATTVAPPSNDLCTDAINLTLSPKSDPYFYDQHKVTATTAGGGNSNLTNECSILNNADIWYTVIVPDSGSFGIATRSIDDPNANTTITIYSGSCNNLTLISCGENGPNNYSYKKLSDQVPGELLYLRVTKYNPIKFNEKPFSIAGFEINPPSNNIPNDALEIPVGIGAFVGNSSIQTTNRDATSSNIATPNCGAYKGHDVWFSVIVPENGNLAVSTKQIPFLSSFITTLELAAYEGTSNNLTQIKCSNDDGWNTEMGNIRLLNRTPGEKLFIRVWIPDNVGSVGLLGDEFLISAYKIANIENNFCETPKELIVGRSFEEQKITIKPFNLTNSMSDASNTCIDSDPIIGSDHWYTATIPESGNLILNWRDHNSYFRTATFIYTGNDCNNLTKKNCLIENGNHQSDREIILTNETPGEKIIIRFINYNISSSDEFEISVYDLTPMNNTCNTSSTLEVGHTFEEKYLIGDINEFANDSDGPLPKNNCFNKTQAYDDVWYSVTVPSSGDLTLEIKDIDENERLENKGIVVYAGNCDALSKITCFAPTSTNNYLNKTTLTNRTPGEILYISVYEWYDFHANTQFRLAAYNDNILSTNDINNSVPEISLYPNPSQNSISIKTEKVFKMLIIYDLLGNIVLKENSFKSSLDISKLTSGMYMMKVYFENNTHKTLQVIKE